VCASQAPKIGIHGKAEHFSTIAHVKRDRENKLIEVMMSASQTVINSCEALTAG